MVQGQNDPATPSYGSRYHLIKYRDSAPEALDAAIIAAVSPEIPGPLLEWIYPQQNETRREPTGIGFLGLDPDQRRAWKRFWPQTGNSLNWDGIACCRGPSRSHWILIEAKANHPEFCSPSTGATPESLKRIKGSLGRTKTALGVHRFFPWHGTYYQYANRLAFLFFLSTINIQAHLVFLYFYGDRFPDETPCPDSPSRWRELIHACHLTLGLTEGHMLQPWVHDAFLPVLAPGANASALPE